MNINIIPMLYGMTLMAMRQKNRAVMVPAAFSRIIEIFILLRIKS